MRGGAVLLGRQLVSIVIGFGSLIALTRLIGPAKSRRVRDGLRRLPLRLRTGGLRRRDVPDQGYGGTDEASARRRVHPRDRRDTFIVCSIGSLPLLVAAPVGQPFQGLDLVGTVLLYRSRSTFSIVAPLFAAGGAALHLQAWHRAPAYQSNSSARASIQLACIDFPLSPPVRRIVGVATSRIFISSSAPITMHIGIVSKGHLFRELLLFRHQFFHVPVGIAAFFSSARCWPALLYLNTISFVAIVVRLSRAADVRRGPAAPTINPHTCRRFWEFATSHPRAVQHGVETAITDPRPGPLGLLPHHQRDHVVPLLPDDELVGRPSRSSRTVSHLHRRVAPFSLVTSLILRHHPERPPS